MKGKFERYGLVWPDGTTDLQVEFQMIRKGGSWTTADGKKVGLGLFEHYMNARKLLWPDRYRHRWTDLMYSEFIKNSVTILMGSGSSQKTSHSSEFALINYWLYPKETLVILSTTTVSKLEMALFGEIKKLWQEARDRWGEYLAGNVIDSKHAIATHAVEEGQARDLRCGLVGVACYVGKQFVGIASFAGIKQKRMFFLADELSFMAPTFLECLPNMFQSCEVLKVIGSGNPKHDPLDQLGRAAEPKAGWESLGEIEKTTVWDTKFQNGRCINLVGTDSPNFDFPEDQPTKYKGLVSWKTVASVSSYWGKDSLEYSKQCKGVMRIGMIGNRVITKKLCEEHRAFEKAQWAGTSRTRIYACDPAWGGINADRCVAGWGEFGIDKDGVQILRVNPPSIIPIIASAGSPLPDDQIAQYIQRDTEHLGIEPEDIFYDSTGRGTTGSAFARIFGLRVPVPISFGDKPSRRPVRHDLFVTEPDKTKRLKRCDEHYRKFVSELWFSVRYLIECDQLRELPEDVMMEGTMREYGTVAGDKIEVEPKDDTRERMGCSPDLFDWCFTGDCLISTPFGSARIDSLKPGDIVLTPFGETTVEIVRVRPSKELTKTVFSDNSSLVGLGDHKVFTWDQGWVSMDSLTIDNECESVDNLPIWNILNSLFTKVGNTGFKRLVDTIRAGSTMTRRDFYTGLSGLSTMGLFLKACASITKTAIGRITGWIIWSYENHLSIPVTIYPNDSQLQDTRNFGCGTMSQPSKPQERGTDQRPVRSGTGSTRFASGRYSGSQSHAPASSVERSLNPYFPVEPNTVPSGARTQLPSESTERNQGFVRYALRGLKFLFTKPKRLAPESVRQFSLPEYVNLYNLTLRNHNAYYANGVLVQNCAILVEGARQRGFKIQRLGVTMTEEEDSHDWMFEEQEAYHDAIKEMLLTH